MAEMRRDQFTEGVKADMYAYSLESYPQESPVLSQIFDVKTSDRAYELGTTAIGPENLIKKKEGEPISYSKAGEGWTVAAKMSTFARGLEFTFEDVQDMNPQKIANTVTDMAGKWTEYYVTKMESEAANYFNYGGYTAGNEIFNASTSGYTDNSGDFVYDGKPFFNLSGNNRALYPGGTASYYNALANAINETNMQALYDLITITNAVDARGEKISIMPDTILYPSNLRWSVMKLLETEKIVGSTNNDINTVKGLLKPVEWRYLTDTDAWFIGKAKSGIKMYNRMPLTFDFWQDKETKGYKASAMARWGFEVNDFRYWASSNLQTS